MDSVEQVMKDLDAHDRAALLGDPDRVEASTATLLRMCLIGLADVRPDNTVMLNGRGLEVRARLLSSGGEG